MSTNQPNDSTVASFSRNCMPLMQVHSGANPLIMSIFLLGNFVVALPANVWMAWLICRRTGELLASDTFLLNLAVCEILYCLGLPVQLQCMYSPGHVINGFDVLLSIQLGLMGFGRPIFQSCICVECYIAVVHPLIFIRLKPLKYTVAQCALAWCFFLVIFLLQWILPVLSVIGLIWFVLTSCMFLYCCLAVLCFLKRARPGERQGEARGRGDKIKRKAFNIILINLLCFLVNYLPQLVVFYLNTRIHVSGDFSEFITALGVVCGLVQPLLYLHRAGKLSCHKSAADLMVER